MALSYFLIQLRLLFCKAGYPPYGLANVSFVGLASFLILTGLYNSAVSVARDVKLRRSIKSSALLQSSKLLDSIGTDSNHKRDRGQGNEDDTRRCLCINATERHRAISNRQ